MAASKKKQKKKVSPKKKVSAKKKAPAQRKKKATPKKKVAAKKKTTKKKAVSPKKAVAQKKAATKKKAVVKKKAAQSALGKMTATIKKAAQKTVRQVADKVQSQVFSFKFSPLDDRVLIRREGASDRTPGGLYIPESASDRPLRGKVLAIGPGRRNKKGQIRPMDVQVGDQIIFSDYAGVSVHWQGEDLLILREEEILGVMRN